MPPRLHQRESKDIFVSARTYHIMDTENPSWDDESYPSTGVISAATNTAHVICGLHTGDINVTVETWDGPPPLDAVDWQDVAEVSLPWTSRQMELWGEGKDGFMIYPEGQAPGTYRVRVSIRNRTAREVAKHGDPKEEHLIQIWPAPPAGDVLHKGESEHGAYWRAARTRSR